MMPRMTTDPSETGPRRGRALLFRVLAAAVRAHTASCPIQPTKPWGASERARLVLRGTPPITVEARRALETWLKSQGFEETPVLNPRGEVRTHAVYERWFAGTHQGSHRFIVE